MNINEYGDKPRRSHAERRAATRRALLDAARELIAEEGYAEVSVEGVVRGAGVTRGALYHYFEDKRDLLRTVVEEMEVELDGLVRGAAREAYLQSGDPLEMFMAGTYAYLDACLRRDVRRILLLDGPSALGWEEWHRIDAEYAIAQIEAGLGHLVGHGLMEPQPVGVLAHLLHGATVEAALFIATADDPEKARHDAGEGLRRLTEGLCKRGSPKPLGRTGIDEYSGRARVGAWEERQAMRLHEPPLGERKGEE